MQIIAFKNNALFTSCISKISIIFIDHAVYLDIVIPIHNLLELSDNYSMTIEKLWNCYADKMNDDNNESNADDYGLNNDKTIASKYFEYKTKTMQETPINHNKLETKVLGNSNI